MLAFYLTLWSFSRGSFCYCYLSIKNWNWVTFIQEQSANTLTINHWKLFHCKYKKNHVNWSLSHQTLSLFHFRFYFIFLFLINYCIYVLFFPLPLILIIFTYFPLCLNKKSFVLSWFFFILQISLYLFHLPFIQLSSPHVL